MDTTFENQDNVDLQTATTIVAIVDTQETQNEDREWLRLMQSQAKFGMQYQEAIRNSLRDTTTDFSYEDQDNVDLDTATTIVAIVDTPETQNEDREWLRLMQSQAKFSMQCHGSHEE